MSARWSRFARILVAIFAAAGIVVPAAGWWLTTGGADPPSFEAVRSGFTPSEALLLDRNGVPIDSIRIDSRGRRLSWVCLDAISPAMVRAILASEDRRFMRHHGVDWRALASAAAGNLLRGGRRGASTISMQLAGMLDGGRGRGVSGRRKLPGKVAQLRRAVALERRWSKGQILEAYLNLVTFRGELQGIDAAARGLFHKAPGGLTGPESIVLSVLVRSPNALPPRVGRRAAVLARAMGGTVSEAEATRLAVETLSVPYAIDQGPSLAPLVARQLLTLGGQRVACTLDAALQRFASESLARQLASLGGQNVTDGAVLIADNRTGEILAYVANGGTLSSAICVDGVAARRQAGSTLKPFLYGLAIERRILTAASLLDDSPLDVQTASGTYRPQNYDRTFRGAVSVRTALASSLNVPAVRTIRIAGEDDFARRLRALGFSAIDDRGDYGASLALGSADVTLLELVNAFRTLANVGMGGPLSLLPGAKPGERSRKMSRESAFIVSDILADRGARAEAFGLDNPLGTPFRASAKTGTSKDMRDNWCIGFTSRYTAGVWVGNFNGAPMWNVSGVSGAAPVWREVMTYLHEGSPPANVKAPPGVLTARVDFPEEVEPGREEWFVAGTEPSAEAAPARAKLPSRIAYPAEGTVVALDPDIPDARQRIFFQARDPSPGDAWRLDGLPAGRADAPSPWAPEAGIHTLELVTAEGRPAHAVRFSVRGRPRATAPPDRFPEKETSHETSGHGGHL
ncbi:MAG TPA: penicillin-binding protein 1C [Candidatus Deferrimicrobiaceae bacterium]